MSEQNNGINLVKQETPSVPTDKLYLNNAAPVNTSVQQTVPVTSQGNQPVSQSNLKFCKFCGAQIPMDAVLCTSCGRQVEQLQGSASGQQPQIIINNSNNANASAVAVGVPMGKKKSKWVCFFLWLFLGLFGGHKFYDGKIGTGILYMFTAGFFCIGWFIDLFKILNRSDPYYV